MPEIFVKGIYRDVLRDARGRVARDAGWRPNLIVLSCRELLAGFMKGDRSENPLGIQSLKVGRGDPAWDLTPPPAPDPNALKGLFDTEPFVIPRERLDLRYLNASGQLSQKPTNRLEVVATLGPDEPPRNPNHPDQPYELREFGLFGSLNGADYMIDYIRHPLIEKDASLTLERRVQLIF
jgi:hypothetical protein